MAAGTAMAAVAISSSFTFGMVLTLLGNIKLTLARRLNIGETRVGGLVSALNLALIPMMIISGIWVDQSGVKLILSIGCLLTALGIYGLTLGNNYQSAVYALIFMGLGSAGIGTASMVLMPRGLWPDQFIASLNLGNVFFAAGALLMPALTDVLMRRLEFGRALTILSLICLIPAFIAVPLEFDAPHSLLSAHEVLKNELLWFAALVFLLYAPFEFAIGTWTTTVLLDLGYKERRAAWVLAGFWASFLAGRLGTALLLHGRPRLESWSAWLLVPLALAIGIVVSNLAGAVSRMRAAFGFLLLGALMGPIFPTLQGLVFKQLPDGGWGTSFGVLFAAGSTSSLILAPLAGAYARKRSVRAAFRLLGPLALMLACATLVFALQEGFVSAIRR